MRATYIVPNTLCVVFGIFAVLLAFDVVNIQINTRFVGRLASGTKCPPTVCADNTAKTNSTTPSKQWAPKTGAKSIEASSTADGAEDVHSASTGSSSGSWENVTETVSQRPKVQKDQLRATGMAGQKQTKFQTPVETSVKQKYAFKMHEPGSMEAEDMEWCPGLRHVDLKPIDEKFKFLFVLGAQKAGTSWLHTSLIRHPLFVNADRAYRGGWNKEVRFFNSYPVPNSQVYLDLFPTRKRLRALYDIPTVFLDSSPFSMFSPSVAPRIKQAIPHAKFIFVLRDPVARTVSSHNMWMTARASDDCTKNPNTYACKMNIQPLLQEFRKQRDLNITWPEDLSGCNFNETVENPSKRRTWGDCWRCDHFTYGCNTLSPDETRALGGCTPNTIPPVPAEVPLTQFGLYAAQIAWWMSFFPPETFLIFTREELQDPDRVVPAMNKILKHVGYPNAQPFTKTLLGRNPGFRGKYSGGMSEDDQQALKEMAEYFEQPNKDLQTLMDTYFPDVGFKGFTPEYTADRLNPYVTKSIAQRKKKAAKKKDTPEERKKNILTNLWPGGKSSR